MSLGVSLSPMELVDWLSTHRISFVHFFFFFQILWGEYMQEPVALNVKVNINSKWTIY